MSKPCHEHCVEAVMALTRACHPTWPPRPRAWYEAVNVLTMHDRGAVVAHASFSITLPPTVDLTQRLGPDALCAILWDTCVAESHRGRDLAGVLMGRRLELAHAAGAQMAIGAAHRSNYRMTSVLTTHGFKNVAQAHNVFPDGTTGDIYIKTLGI